MAYPQKRLEDFLGKFGLASDSEAARKAMISRLKDVRDPLERDRIIWSLAGQSKPDAGYRPAAVGAPSRERSVMKPSPQPSGAPSPPQQLRMGKLANFIVPIIFILFGISNIGKALDSWARGGNKEEVFMQLLIGGMFIVFAIVGLFSKKLKDAIEKAREQAQSGGR
jgi:hypothetical protein